MGLIIFGFRLFLENIIQAKDLVIFVSAVALGIVSYISLLFIIDKNTCVEVFQLIKRNFFQKSGRNR